MNLHLGYVSKIVFAVFVLRETFFPKWKQNLQGNYGDMGSAACREIQAWNSQPFGSRADLEACIFKKKTFKGDLS